MQIGDIIYYQSTQSVVGEDSLSYTQTIGDPVQVGAVSSIDQFNRIIIDIPSTSVIPGNSYLFFVKPVNKSSVRGYYMDVTMENNKTSRAELFGVATNIAESSK